MNTTSPESPVIEPLVDSVEFAYGLDIPRPLKGVRLSGLRGGRVRSSDHIGNARFMYLRPFEDGDDPSKIDAEATAEDPDHFPIIGVHSANVTPSLWVVSDMLKNHNRWQDGFYDKRGMALSAIYSLMATAVRSPSQQPMPLAAALANDYRVDVSDRPVTGRFNLLDIGDRITDLLEEDGPLADIEDRPNLSGLLGYVGSMASRKIVAIVSDFRGPFIWPDHCQDDWQGELHDIADRGNQIIAVEIQAPEDSRMPEMIHTIGHSPRGRVWAGRQGDILREEYAKNALLQQEAIDASLRKVDAIHVQLRTDTPSWSASLADQLVNPQSRAY